MISDQIAEALLSEAELGGITIRQPMVKDVPAMAIIINDFASRGLMLPRSHHNIYQTLRDFTVVESEDEIVACGAMHIVWGDIGEVRSLAVVEEWQRRGVGRLIVDILLGEAHAFGLPKVFALTYQQGFFERLGFAVVARESLPHKIWGDCLDCPKFPNCDEIAMTINVKNHGGVAP